jgi:hypothetical protein
MSRVLPNLFVTLCFVVSIACQVVSSFLLRKYFNPFTAIAAYSATMRANWPAVIAVCRSTIKW